MAPGSEVIEELVSRKLQKIWDTGLLHDGSLDSTSMNLYGLRAKAIMMQPSKQYAIHGRHPRALPPDFGSSDALV